METGNGVVRTELLNSQSLLSFFCTLDKVAKRPRMRDRLVAHNRAGRRNISPWRPRCAKEVVSLHTATQIRNETMSSGHENGSALMYPDESRFVFCDRLIIKYHEAHFRLC